MLNYVVHKVIRLLFFKPKGFRHNTDIYRKKIVSLLHFKILFFIEFPFRKVATTTQMFFFAMKNTPPNSTIILFFKILLLEIQFTSLQIKMTPKVQ